MSKTRIPNCKLTEEGKTSRGCQVPKEDRWQYPPYFTVDDLCIYRKRRQNVSSTKDNLKLSEGSFKHLKTEYKRRFKNFYELLKAVNGRQRSAFTANQIKPDASLKLEGLHDFHSEYNEAYNKLPAGRLTNRPQQLIESDQMELEVSTRPVPTLEDVAKLLGRPNLQKRPTTLKLEGDFSYLTEHAENFIEYLIAKRAELLRTPTHLKLEGDMETKTESSEQFVRYDNAERPTLCKKFTQLHLEGEFDRSTENKHMFGPLELSKRPPLIKTSTNLQLDGDLDFVGEYAQQFIDYKGVERSKPALPQNNLKLGDLFESTSNEVKLFDTKFHPEIPFLREPYSRKEPEVARRTPSKSPSRRSVLKQTDNKEPAGLPSRVYSHPNLIITRASNSTLASSTYDVDYDHNSQKRFDSLPSRSRKRQSQIDYLMDDGKIDMQPEYSSSYVDFPRERPRVRRPEGQLASYGEVQYVTEKTDKYTPHRFVEKSESCKREPQLKLEGRLECQPEYRKAYIDYLMREKKPPAVQRRRAYDLLDGTQKADATPNGIVSSSDTADTTNVSTTSSKTRPKSKLQLPENPNESLTTSIPTSPKPPRRGRRASRSQIAHFEDAAFGPTIPKRGSQTPSPAPGSRRGSRGRRGSRHSSPRDKSGWKSDPTQDSFPRAAEADAAFLILDKFENRNNIRNCLYKEQKWMPSWNYST